MSELLSRELYPILRAIVIHSPAAFSFAGQMINVVPSPAPSVPGAPPPPHPLVAQLAGLIYQYGFTRRFDGQPPQPMMPAQDDSLLPELSAANTGIDRWESGWQILQLLPSGQVLAQRFGIVRAFWPGEFMTLAGPGMAPQVGAAINVRVPRESAVMQQGFYYCFGQTVADQQSDFGIVRFYWNMQASGAPNLVHAVTQEFNRWEIPFRFKCLLYRSSYVRLDSALLYVNKRYYRTAAALVDKIYSAIQAQMGQETPIFARRLAPGLAFAEDPGNGESFGSNRTRLVAEGIWNSYLSGLQNERDRLSHVIQVLQNNGLSPERPYLNPRSADDYEFPKRREPATHESTQ